MGDNGGMKAPGSKTTLNLDDELHKRMRLLSIEKGTTLTALVDEALRQYLERETKKERRRKR